MTMATMFRSNRGMFRRRRLKSVPRKLRPLGEPLEPRTLLAAASNPFDTPQFQEGLAKAIGDQKAPDGTVASIAFIRDGQLFTEESPGISSDALFRIGSVSKTFAAAAVMVLVQDGRLSLDDSAMSLLGYSPDRLVTGYDPLTQQPVSALPTPALFKITVAQLLNMTSGLPNDVTVASQTYPRAPSAPPIYNEGSYAALAFAGGPPYHQPATAQQQWNYAVYEISADITTHPLTHGDSTPNVLSPPGKTYDYNDLNYTVLGLIVSKLAQQDYGLSYMGYLQTYVLGPMGIAPPMAQPVTNDAMVGLGHTLLSQRYPTEVTYKSKSLPQPSIFPAPARTMAPFYPIGVLQPLPYGGGFWLESHYANGGLVATPTALATFFANLSGSYAGTTAGPISQQTVATMVAKPPNGADLPKHKGWFGLGMAVYKRATGDENSWVKPGALPGNSAIVCRYADGAVLAIAINYDVYRADKAKKNSPPNFMDAVQALVNEAAYDPASIVATGGSGQKARVNTTFAEPMEVRVTDAFGAPVHNAKVTFAAPTSGQGGSFFRGRTKAKVATGSDGVAVAPAFTANGTPGSYAVTASVSNPARAGSQTTFALVNEQSTSID
jgi:CubicO group peptidase (beta-lactamase class C family)